GRDVADDRYRHRVAPQLVDLLLLHQLDRPRLARVTLDETAPLELVEMVVNSGAGGQPDRLADLADAGRIVADARDVADVVEDLRLALAELFGHLDSFREKVGGSVQKVARRPCYQLW